MFESMQNDYGQILNSFFQKYCNNDAKSSALTNQYSPKQVAVFDRNKKRCPPTKQSRICDKIRRDLTLAISRSSCLIPDVATEWYRKQKEQRARSEALKKMSTKEKCQAYAACRNQGEIKSPPLKCMDMKAAIRNAVTLPYKMSADVKRISPELQQLVMAHNERTRQLTPLNGLPGQYLTRFLKPKERMTKMCTWQGFKRPCLCAERTSCKSLPSLPSCDIRLNRAKLHRKGFFESFLFCSGKNQRYPAEDEDYECRQMKSRSLLNYARSQPRIIHHERCSRDPCCQDICECYKEKPTNSKDLKKNKHITGTDIKPMHVQSGLQDHKCSQLYVQRADEKKSCKKTSTKSSKECIAKRRQSLLSCKSSSDDQIAIKPKPKFTDLRPRYHTYSAKTLQEVWLNPQAQHMNDSFTSLHPSLHAPRLPDDSKPISKREELLRSVSNIKASGYILGQKHRKSRSEFFARHTKSKKSLRQSSTSDTDDEAHYSDSKPRVHNYSSHWFKDIPRHCSDKSSFYMAAKKQAAIQKGAYPKDKSQSNIKDMHPKMFGRKISPVRTREKIPVKISYHDMRPHLSGHTAQRKPLKRPSTVSSAGGPALSAYCTSKYSPSAHSLSRFKTCSKKPEKSPLTKKQLMMQKPGACTPRDVRRTRSMAKESSSHIKCPFFSKTAVKK